MSSALASGSARPGSAAAAPASTVLRVLSGANAGAEMRLTQGEWLIGSGPEADITFAEPALAAAHLRILVGASGVRMVALAPGVPAGPDALAPGSELDLATLAPVRIGETCFAVGPSGSDWASVSTARAPSPGPVAGEVPEAKAKGKAPKPKAAAPTAADAPAAARPPTAGDAPPPGAPPPRRRLWRRLALAVAVLAAIGAGVWAAYTRGVFEHRVAVPGPPEPAPDPAQTANAVIRALNFQRSVTATAHGDGRVAVSGRLQTEDQARHLAAELRRVGVHAELAVATDATIVDLAVTILRGYGVDAAVSVSGPGVVSVRGYGPGGTDVDAALARLRTDVQGVSSVEDGIITPDRARATMETRLRAAGLARSLRVVAAEHKLTVSGLLGAEALPAWTAVAERFRREHGDLIRFVQVRVPCDRLPSRRPPGPGAVSRAGGWPTPRRRRHLRERRPDHCYRQPPGAGAECGRTHRPSLRPQPQLDHGGRG